MEEKLRLTKKLKGEDNHKTISIRFEGELVKRLDKLANETGRSRNELVNTLLYFAVDRCELIEDPKSDDAANSNNS